MTGYDFHPEARADLDEIWEFIRADNLAGCNSQRQRVKGRNRLRFTGKCRASKFSFKDSKPTKSGF